MGSAGFDGEDESQPSTSNGKKYKSPRRLRQDFSAVNYASVPRKLRSAIKNRGRESVVSPLSISKKQRHVLIGVQSLRKNGAKKSKLNMKPGHITKDEEEVAETLYALAHMFSDANNSNQPGSNDEQLKTKSSAILEPGSSMKPIEDTGTLTLHEESRKISSKVTLDTSCQSSIMVDSMAQVVKQPELPNSKQPAIPSTFGVQSDLRPGDRPAVATVDMTTSSDKEAIDQKPVTATQYGKNYNPIVDKSKGLYLSSLSATGVSSSETPGPSCLRLPAWFESTNYASQPRAPEEDINPEKYTRAPVESKTLWKKCSAHVYISRLIKVLQISERKDGLLEKPTQLTTCEGAELRPHVSSHNETMGIHGISSSGITHSAEIQNDILLHKRPLEDQHLASETSALCSSSKQSYDFLSLGSGVCGLDANDGIDRSGHSHEALEQFHRSSQNHSATLLSLPQNGYSSTFHGHNTALAAQQIQLPQYLNSRFTSQMGQQLESQQQKWAAQLPKPYNTGGVGAPHLPNWKNRGRGSSSVLNYAHTLFPHLDAALASKYQQFSPSQQQLMAMNSSMPLSNAKRHHHQLAFGFERNGTAFYHENIQQLQLPCNQHL
ncbi:hypothetical protein CDL12_28018 [Handroanthus impetiginosus]|uniref:Uncharacterized protein n=1 Tax=Handroanthus impetiginosus TaxID=429701 RepID=A0A2G9G2G5_9LAMI|nr:hypothetical protein CDL12_28018 [Handroanthus impetiginosus]